MANLLEEKGLEPIPQWAFIRFNLHRNTGCIHKAHQSLSGSNDQTIDNIQRTMWAYSESGSDSQRAKNKKAHSTVGQQTHFIFGPLSFKLRVFLEKQVSQDFMHSFLGLIAPRNPPFPA